MLLNIKNVIIITTISCLVFNVSGLGETIDKRIYVTFLHRIPWLLKWKYFICYGRWSNYTPRQVWQINMESEKYQSFLKIHEIYRQRESPVLDSVELVGCPGGPRLLPPYPRWQWRIQDPISYFKETVWCESCLAAVIKLLRPDPGVWWNYLEGGEWSSISQYTWKSVTDVIVPPGHRWLLFLDVWPPWHMASCSLSSGPASFRASNQYGGRSVHDGWPGRDAFSTIISSGENLVVSGFVWLNELYFCQTDS